MPAASKWFVLLRGYYLPVDLVAIVAIISRLLLACSLDPQFSAIWFAFISSSRVMLAFAAAATITDAPPVKMAVTGSIITEEFFTI